MQTPEHGDEHAVRIGVYVCHCGSNIAAMVDVKGVAERASKLAGVVVAREYKYMCSDPGQELIKNDIRDHQLNRIVVASCSPHLHEKTFRGAVWAGGLNPYQFQMVNIREHASWVHTDQKAATEKADALVRAAVARVRHHVPLETRQVPVNAAVLVVGGGIAGIHAALMLADAGKHVYLVEREPTIGGHMAHVRQDVPHPGLRGVHPDAQDDAGEEPQEHHAVGVLRGEGGQRLRRELQGEGPPQAALHHRGRLHRVPGVHRRLHLQAGPKGRRVQPRHVEAPADLPSVPAGRAADRHHRSRGLHRVQVAQVQEDLRGGVRRPERDRLQPEGNDRGDRGRHHHADHRLQGVRRQAGAAVRLRDVPASLHGARGGAALERLGSDGRRGGAARTARRRAASASSTASAAATSTPTSTARGCAACTR